MFRITRVILWLTLAISSFPVFGQFKDAAAGVIRDIPNAGVQIYQTSRIERNRQREIEAQRQVEMARISAEERTRTAQIMNDGGLGGIQTTSTRNGTIVTAGSVIGTPYERIQADNNAAQTRIAEIQANQRRQDAADQRQFSIEQFRRDNGCPEDPRKPCVLKK